MIETKLYKISEIKPNPNNPRIIKDDKFLKLVNSIKEFPEMLKIRPIVINEDNIVLGGNMRLKACKEAKLKEIPVIMASELTEAQQREFIIKDNIGFGEWDFQDLAQNWDSEELETWGLDFPIFMNEPNYEDLIGDEKNKPATLKITFESPEQLQKAEIDIQELLDRKYKGAYFSVSAGEI
jgi:ParB-like chromosome segregation protein Spo0J